MKIIRKKYKNVKKAKTAVFGFPGIGNVSKVVVDFLIEKLNAQKVMDIYSDVFPNAVIIEDDFTVDLPKIEVFKYKDILFFSGDVQPSKEIDSHEMAEELVKIAKGFGVKEIITLGGIGLEEEPLKPKVYAAMNDEKYRKKLERYGINFKRKGAAIIIGLSGLILFYAKTKKIKGFSLLAEASTNGIGLRASRSIIDILTKYLKIKVSTKDLDEEIKKMHVKEMKEKKLNQEMKKIFSVRRKVNYIG